MTGNTTVMTSSNDIHDRYGNKNLGAKTNRGSMDNLQTHMHKRLAKQNRTVQSLGAYCLHALKEYWTYPEAMHCVIKWSRLDRYVDDREDTLELHHRRVVILAELKKNCIDKGFAVEQLEKITSIRVRSAKQLQRD